MQTIVLCVLLTFFSDRDSRAVVVYDTPSQVVSASLGETVMARATKEQTYRLAVYIETEPGEGCEYDTVLYFAPSYVGAGGISGGKHIEVKIRKDGSADAAEIPATVFRVKAGSHVGFHVEYMIGGRCKTRPSYQVFPVLERIGAK